jgi:hypothetical protein
MTESPHLTAVARVRDEELAGRESSPAARALLAAIQAESTALEPDSGGSRPVERRPGLTAPRRLVAAAAVVAAVTTVVVVGPSIIEDGTGNASSYANSAIEIRRDGDFFVARIKDPLADHAKYVEAFRAVGKDVEIRLVPVSPRLVGMRIRSSGGTGSMSSEVVSPDPARVDCGREPARCTLVIRVSADMKGTTRYTLGRAARPGEPVQDPVVGPGPGN